jgi:excisionase family DNA binding protein
MRARTVEQVAEMWGCSANHVRQMCKDGRLRHFRLGPKTIRIPIEAVEEFECQGQTTGLAGSEATGSSLGPKTEAVNASAFFRARQANERAAKPRTV